MMRQLMLTFLVGLGFANVCGACECAGKVPPCAAKERADVFTGTVLDVSASLEEQRSRSIKPLNPFQVSRLTVDEDFTGLGRAEIVLRTPVFPGACGYSFQRGHRYLVFATLTEQPNIWATSICSRTAPVESKRAELDLAYLRALKKPGHHGVVWGRIGSSVTGRFDGFAPGVLVTISASGNPPGDRGLKQASTNQEGLFEFRELVEGRYMVGLPGFKGYSREVEVRKGGCEGVHFLLPDKDLTR